MIILDATRDARLMGDHTKHGRLKDIFKSMANAIKNSTTSVATKPRMEFVRTTSCRSTEQSNVYEALRRKGTLKTLLKNLAELFPDRPHRHWREDYNTMLNHPPATSYPDLATQAAAATPA